MAESGALLAIAGNRNAARWQVAGVEQQRPLFAGSPQEDAIELPAPTVAQDLLADYATVGLTLGAHPLSLVRHHLAKERCIPSDELVTRRSGSRVRVAGLVTLRQRPETAKGTTFVTLEDEAGNVQVIVWASVAERQRKALLGSKLLVVDGRWDCADGAGNVIADRVRDLSSLLGSLDARSRNFH